MATITPTRSVTERQTSVAITHTWAALANGDEGAPVGHEFYRDRSVQVFGTFDTGNVTWMGSLDGSNWAPLSDPQGNVLTLSAAKIESVLEAVKFIKPVVVGGSGTTNLTCMLLIGGSV